MPDDVFIREFESLGPAAMARAHSWDVRGVYRRRKGVEGRVKRTLVVPDEQKRIVEPIRYPGRINVSLQHATVLVASDCHYWPGDTPFMHKALVRMCKELRPSIVILNGDVFDGAAVSRHPPMGWDKVPDVQPEIEACQEHLFEIEQAAGKARKIWTLGNHDQRFERSIAVGNPKFRGVKGTSLKDHFPLWEPAWSVMVNDHTQVKHRQAGGVHANYNNTLKSGVSMVTGHLHSANVYGLTDLRGTRFACDTGCIADPWGPQFEYLEDSTRNWREGFAVLTFRNGALLPPELVLRWGDSVVFRGAVTHV